MGGGGVGGRGRVGGGPWEGSGWGGGWGGRGRLGGQSGCERKIEVFKFKKKFFLGGGGGSGSGWGVRVDVNEELKFL